MPVPRYHWLPVKGNQYRILASPYDGTGDQYGVPPLRAVTTVSDPELAARLTSHLTAAAELSYAAVVTGEPSAGQDLAAGLPEPVARTVTAEVADVVTQIAAEVTYPGEVAWLARCAAESSAPLDAGRVVYDEELEQQLTLPCTECTCLHELDYFGLMTGTPGWREWVEGGGTVTVTWMESIARCDGDCDCHGLGRMLPGVNPLAALLDEVGMRWAEASPAWRVATLTHLDAIGTVTVDGVTAPAVMRSTGLPLDTPTVLLTDLVEEVQFALGCHRDVPGRWFTVLRSLEDLGPQPDYDDTVSFIARTANFVREDAGWSEEAQLVDVPLPADPADPATWPSAKDLLEATFGAEVPAR